MIQIGKNVKYDCYGRVTVPKKLAVMMNLIKGQDEVCWVVSDGEVILKKITKTYHGMNFEEAEIRDSLRSYESKYSSEKSYDDCSPEELERIALQEYLHDKAEREALATLKKKRYS